MIIINTNVLSELMKRRQDPAVARWTAKHKLIELFTTSVTKAEILYGIELLPSGKRRDGLLAEAEQMFSIDLAGRILAFDSDSALHFATIAADRRFKGRPISELNAQIAAIARNYNARLATRNTSDFEHCGIKLIDPWQA